MAMGANLFHTGSDANFLENPVWPNQIPKTKTGCSQCYFLLEFISSRAPMILFKPENERLIHREAHDDRRDRLHRPVAAQGFVCGEPFYSYHNEFNCVSADWWALKLKAKTNVKGIKLKVEAQIRAASVRNSLPVLKPLHHPWSQLIFSHHEAVTAPWAPAYEAWRCCM